MRSFCGADENKPHLEGCSTLKTVKVISLGAGVQSSAMLLMSDRGEIPMADFAVFADTQSEPPEVYEWLEKLKKAVSIPIYIGTKGSLINDSYKSISEGDRFSSIPFFVKAGNGYQESMIRRQCTKDYKIDVVRKIVRTTLGYEPKQRVKHNVEMYIGISLDESIRMKDSMDAWITNKYPLVFDKPMHRQQCIQYVQNTGLGTPPRSSCIICPFHSNAEWRHLRDKYPDMWEKAVLFDKDHRKIPRLQNETFLHRSLKPLDEAPIDDTSGQLDMFNNECEGMCGV
jgi:hypothetical protein